MHRIPAIHIIHAHKKLIRSSPAIGIKIVTQKVSISTLTTVFPIFSPTDLLFNSLLTFKYYFLFFFYYILLLIFPSVRSLFLVLLPFSFGLKHTEREIEGFRERPMRGEPEMKRPERPSLIRERTYELDEPRRNPSDLP